MNISIRYNDCISRTNYSFILRTTTCTLLHSHGIISNISNFDNLIF